jgi:hypothetical protein
VTGADKFLIALPFAAILFLIRLQARLPATMNNRKDAGHEK